MAKLSPSERAQKFAEVAAKFEQSITPAISEFMNALVVESDYSLVEAERMLMGRVRFVQNQWNAGYERCFLSPKRDQ